MFFRGSRYEHIADTERTDRLGVTTRYKRMRFIPAVEAAAGDTVRQGDRPDLVAYRTLGDPEQFWRVCDANEAVEPEELIEPGARLTISGPQP